MPSLCSSYFLNSSLHVLHRPRPLPALRSSLHNSLTPHLLPSFDLLSIVCHPEVISTREYSIDCRQLGFGFSVFFLFSRYSYKQLGFGLSIDCREKKESKMMPPQYDFLLRQGPQSHRLQGVFVMAEPTKKMKTTAIEVMREGSIVQSGKYNSLLDFGLDFKALVYAHDASMELVGVETKTESNASPKELLMSSDYWLSYETSDANAASFSPSLFISVYAIIAAVAFRLVLLRGVFVSYVGLKTSQIFFGQSLHIILHTQVVF